MKNLQRTKAALAVLLMLLLTAGCQREQPQTGSLINTAHLDHLSRNIEVKGLTMRIVYIYAEAPDYELTDAEGEGIACVDDVARAAVFYLRHYRQSQNSTSLEKARKMLNFLQYMQAPNGLFYNFIFADYSINKTRENSRPVANWWTWRAFWALAEAVPIFQEPDPGYARNLQASLSQVYLAMDSILQKYPQMRQNKGLQQPDWLPFGSAADQAAAMLLGMLAVNKDNPDSLLQSRMRKIGEGIARMQAGDSASFPFGAMLSWQNLWHAWGNSQSDALLKTGGALAAPHFIRSGLREVQSFFPFLLEKEYLSEFTVGVRSDRLQPDKLRRFPQIAYGIRPMVWACLSAFEATGNQSYADRAAEIAGWLFGRNPSGALMYSPETGRCYDGIVSANEINRNSGAESTIEALLTLLEIEKYPQISRQVKAYFREARHKEQNE
ncbi:MAG: hypothetical protein WAN36_04405 [Calditrichia bacterium]